MKEKKIKKNFKAYSLTSDDISFLHPRRQHLEILQETIEDMQNRMTLYLNQVVRPRLGIKPQEMITVDVSRGVVEVERDKKKDKTKKKRPNGETEKPN